MYESEEFRDVWWKRSEEVRRGEGDKRKEARRGAEGEI